MKYSSIGNCRAMIIVQTCFNFCYFVSAFLWNAKIMLFVFYSNFQILYDLALNLHAKCPISYGIWNKILILGFKLKANIQVLLPVVLVHCLVVRASYLWPIVDVPITFSLVIFKCPSQQGLLSCFAKSNVIAHPAIW